MILLYGKHPVIAALSNQNRKCYRLLTTKQNIPLIEERAKLRNIPVVITDKAYLDKLVYNQLHQGLVLECKTIFKNQVKIDIDEQISQIVILDQITDIQNIGSIIRSAHAFKASMIIMPQTNSPAENGSIAKASAGSIEKIAIIKVTNITNTLKQLQKLGYWIISLHSHTTKTIDNFELPKKCAFIVGSEDKGIRHLVKNSSDIILKIPMVEGTESLNVSCAASIILYKFYSENHL